MKQYKSVEFFKFLEHHATLLERHSARTRTWIQWRAEGVEVKFFYCSPCNCSGVPEYECCVNKLRQNVGFQTWKWRHIM